MSHFAKIENNVVSQVIVVNNSDILDNEGVESETVGIQFCTDLLGGVWLQTSYNGNMRKHYAGIGDSYDSVRDAFISPQPYTSWVLNEDTCIWEAPVASPEGITGELPTTVVYNWDEASLAWVVNVDYLEFFKLKLLADSDYTVLVDYVGDDQEAWITYRQEVRAMSVSNPVVPIKP